MLPLTHVRVVGVMRDTMKYATEGPIVSEHALLRWAERVQPGASQGQAETQILNAVAAGAVLAELPDWIEGSQWRGDEYVVCSAWPGVVLRVHYRESRRVITTVLVRPEESQ